MNNSATASHLQTEVNLVIKNHVLGAAAIGVLPLPVVDLAGLAVLQAAMLKKISELNGQSTSDKEAMNLVIGLTGGVAGILFGPNLVRSLFKLVPGIGSVSGAAAVSISAGTVTYALGRILQSHFDEGGSSIKEMTTDAESRLKEEMEKGREWVTETISNARDNIADKADKVKSNLKGNNADETQTPAATTAPADQPTADQSTSEEEQTETAPSVDLVQTEIVVPEPCDPAADDLKKIEGIGPKIAGLCNDAGIHTFQDMSNSPIEKLQQILEDAGSRYRLADPSTWPHQASLAADGKWDELKELQDNLKGGRQVP